MDTFDRLFSGKPEMASLARGAFIQNRLQALSIADLGVYRIWDELGLIDLESTEKYFNSEKTARSYYNVDSYDWSLSFAFRLLYDFIMGNNIATTRFVLDSSGFDPSRISDGNAISYLIHRCLEIYSDDLRIVDFGGHTGAGFFYGASQFQRVASYQVVDLPAVTKVGREVVAHMSAQPQNFVQAVEKVTGSSGNEFTRAFLNSVRRKSEMLSFAEALPDSLEGHIVIINGVTMHLADPMGVIRDILARRPMALLIGNNMCQPTELVERFKQDFLIVQNIDGNIFAERDLQTRHNQIHSLARPEVFTEIQEGAQFRLSYQVHRPPAPKIFYHPESEFLQLSNMRIEDFYFFT